MTDVFLSYARGNSSEAQRFAAQLRSCGFSLWFDEHLPAHRAFSEVIEEQLEAAKSVVVLWSREAVASQWVRSEANRGRERGRLVQIRLDDARRMFSALFWSLGSTMFGQQTFQMLIELSLRLLYRVRSRLRDHFEVRDVGEFDGHSRLFALDVRSELHGLLN